MSDNVIKIGELLVRAGVVTGVDLSEAEKLAKHMSLQFGRVLIMSGCLSEHDLDCALVAQQLIREELLTVEVACQALAVASQHQMPMEDALEALNVVPKYGSATVDLAELLADAAIIPGEMLESALMTSLKTNISLGDLLVQEEAISPSLIPILNTMLADIREGILVAADAIAEIRKTYYTWRKAQDSLSEDPMSQTPVIRMQESNPTPVFVSQELMHSFEFYEQPQPAQQSQQQHTPPTPPSYPAQPQAAPHSIHDVLSMFQQRNPTAEPSAPPPPPEQQAASWSAFVQSQSFDPNDDVEPVQTPPMSVVDEPRLRSSDEPARPVEVVQGTYAKTFDGKPVDHLEEDDVIAEDDVDEPPVFAPKANIEPAFFEPREKASSSKVFAFVPPAVFEPAEEPTAHIEHAATESQQPEAEESTGFDPCSPLVELLIESGYFDREDVIVATMTALKEEARAIRLIEVLGLADAQAVKAASICAEALRKFELNPDEAIGVLYDIKCGAEIHEALAGVNLELAVTVSASLQSPPTEEVDDSFYVGDVSRTVDIFEADDFAEEERQAGAVASSEAAEGAVSAEAVELVFGYGRERLRIANARKAEVETEVGADFADTAPEPEPVKEIENPVVSEIQAEQPVSPFLSLVSENLNGEEIPLEPVLTTPAELSDDEKSKARKRNATTFNSLQAVFVPPTESLTKPSEPEAEAVVESPQQPENQQSEIETEQEETDLAAVAVAEDVQADERAESGPADEMETSSQPEPIGYKKGTRAARAAAKSKAKPVKSTTKKSKRRK